MPESDRMLHSRRNEPVECGGHQSVIQVLWDIDESGTVFEIMGELETYLSILIDHLLLIGEKVR